MAKTESKKRIEGETERPPSFEKALARLEEIVEQLDDGNLPLDRSLALFKEGTKLTKACREMLAEAEVQVKEALRDSGESEIDESESEEEEVEDEGG